MKPIKTATLALIAPAMVAVTIALPATPHANISARGDDQPTRERWRLVPIPVLTGVLAVIGAVVLALFLSGCRGLFGGQVPSASSRAATPSTGPTHRVTATVPVGRDPMGVAVDPDTHTVYVANLGDNSVSVIDGSTRTVTATVPVGKSPWWGVAVDPGTHTVYVPNLDGDTVSVIDASTRTVTATVPVARTPVGVAVDPDTHTVYVANSGDGTVSVIDGSTRTVTATVPVGKGPHGVAPVGRGPGGVAVDPGTHTVYVTNNDDTVSVIDASTRTVTATVAVGGGPRGVAVDPGTHTVYVTITSVSGNGTVSAIESR